ncbi:hypothetical protein BJ956_002560 [Arthrobacter psychrochitiniphilus]|nr:hypothetical protein [Arthrobacter psychrochitiniphilus]
MPSTSKCVSSHNFVNMARNFRTFTIDKIKSTLGDSKHTYSALALVCPFHVEVDHGFPLFTHLFRGRSVT